VLASQQRAAFQIFGLLKRVYGLNFLKNSRNRALQENPEMFYKFLKTNLKNKKYMQQQFWQNFTIVCGSIFLSTTISYAVLAWKEPSSSGAGRQCCCAY